MTQIGGYLSPEEHRSFKAYAAEFQLSESALAKLLIVRELRCRRLRVLKGRFPSGAPANSRERVTAHQAGPELKAAFDARTTEEGMKPDQAASVLFRAELHEHWLANAITLPALESS